MPHPRRSSAMVAVGLPLIALLAGCSGGPGNPEGDAVLSEPSRPGDDTGTIQGLVVTREWLPIPGADLLLIPTELTVTSGEDGSYAFPPVPPGQYGLKAVRLGYLDTDTAVTVAPGEVTNQDLVMEEEVHEAPGSEVIGPITGFYQCRWGVIGVTRGPCGLLEVCPASTCVSTSPVSDEVGKNDKGYVNFRLTRPDWQEIFIEARWTPSTVATNPQMVLALTFEGGSRDHYFAMSDDQASPANLTYTRSLTRGNVGPGEPLEPDLNHTLRAWLDVGTDVFPNVVTLAVDTRFETMVTVFYGSARPENYTTFQ